jgi:hypothetical protein
LPGFCRIESSSGGMLLMWTPLWRPCLPKIGHGGPEVNRICVVQYQIFFITTQNYVRGYQKFAHGKKSQKWNKFLLNYPITLKNILVVNV